MRRADGRPAETGSAGLAAALDEVRLQAFRESRGVGEFRRCLAGYKGCYEDARRQVQDREELSGGRGQDVQAGATTAALEVL